MCENRKFCIYGVYSFSSLSYTLNPGDSCYIRIVFDPQNTQNYSDSLDIRSDDPNDPIVSINLAGTGANSEIGVSPASHDFGTVNLNTTVSQDVTISNPGCVDLIINGITRINL